MFVADCKRPTSAITPLMMSRATFTSFRGLLQASRNARREAAHLPAIENPPSFLVIDDINALETGARSDYRDLLNDVHTWVREHESVAFLHCFDTADVGPHRSLTLNRVDQVWWLQLQPRSQDIVTKLYVTKARNARALTEPISLIMTDDIRIDTSRTI